MGFSIGFLTMGTKEISIFYLITGFGEMV